MEEERIVCPIIEACGEFLTDEKIKEHVSTMTRNECIEDECEYYESCWRTVQQTQPTQNEEG